MTRTLKNAKPWITVTEAVTLTGVSESTIWRILREGTVPTRRVTLRRTVLIDTHAITRAVATRHAETRT